jgi:hypothetical protein
MQSLNTIFFYVSTQNVQRLFSLWRESATATCRTLAAYVRLRLAGIGPRQKIDPDQSFCRVRYVHARSPRREGNATARRRSTQSEAGIAARKFPEDNSIPIEKSLQCSHPSEHDAPACQARSFSLARESTIAASGSAVDES